MLTFLLLGSILSICPSIAVLAADTVAESIRPTPPGFSFSDGFPQVEENAGQLLLYVTRGADALGTATVDFATTDHSAIAGKDYVSAKGTLHFAADETFQVISVSILNNRVPDPSRDFKVSLSNPSSGTPLGDTPEATVTILDNDVGFHFTDPDPSVSEDAGEIVLTVIREGDFTGTATVDFSTLPGSAMPNVDYTPVTGSLTFAEDEQTKAIRVPILNDSIAEGEETFQVTLGRPVGGVPIGLPSSATVHILDNDIGFEFEQGGYFITETNGFAVLRVLRLGDFGVGTVDFSTLPGTATPHEDYLPVFGRLHFEAGDLFQEIQIPILNDNLAESNETFQVVLSNPSAGIPLGTLSTATVQIQDDEIGFEFDVSDLVVNEADGTAIVRVLRLGDFGAASVDYSTIPGSATPDQDYTSVSGTLNFGPTDRMKAITIPILNDRIAESNETFQVILANSTAGVPIGPTRRLTVTIEDNDTGFELQATSISVNEADGFALLRVDRHGDFRAGTVDYVTRPGSAVEGMNYIPVRGTLAFGTNDSFQFIEIPILRGGLNDAGATFDLELQNPSGGIPLGAIATTTIQINPSPWGFGFESADSFLSEASGTIVVAVNKFGNFGAGSVEFTTQSGSATSGSDFMPVSGTLHFKATDSVQYIRVPIVNDGISEPEETFTLVLSNPTGGIPLGGKYSTTIHIQDNDHGYTLSNPQMTVYESDGKAVVAVNRDGDYPFASTVGYRIVLDGASPSDVYPPIEGTLRFSPGTNLQNITVPLLNDHLANSARTYRILLKDPSDGVPIQPGFDQSVLFVVDNDLGYRIDETEPGLLLVKEKAGNALITVFRDGDFNAASTVDFAVTDSPPQGGDFERGTAVAGQDFVATTGTLHFGPQDRQQLIAFPLIDNNRIDNDKTLWIRLFNPSAAVPIQSGYPPGAKLVILRDDEQNPVRVDPGFHAAVLPDPCDDRHSADWKPHFLIDGRIVFEKSRVQFDGSDGKTIVRLLPNGDLDSTFQLPKVTQDIFLYSLLPDGKLLADLGTQLIRINHDGTVDPTFRAQLPETETSVQGVLLQPDGRMIVGCTGGNPASWVLRRLNTNGTLDASFHETRDHSLMWPILTQPSGSFLVLNGKGDTIRFGPDGARDPGFLVPFTSFPIAMQPGGELLYGEDPVLRLTPDGEFDSSFVPIEHARAVAPAPDGRLWVLRFAQRDESSFPPQLKGLVRLERLLPDGSMDPSWSSATLELGQRFCSDALVVEPNGNLLLSGSFVTVNGQARRGLARLTADVTKSRYEVAPESAIISENAGTAGIEILRVGDHSAPMTLTWATAGGSAVSGSDYQPGAGTVTFGQGEYRKSILLTVLDNALPDYDRTVGIHLVDSRGVAYPDLEVTIANDDLGFAPGSIRRFPNGRVLLEPTGRSLPTGEIVIQYSDDLEVWNAMNPLNPLQPALDETTSPHRYYRVIEDPDQLGTGTN